MSIYDNKRYHVYNANGDRVKVIRGETVSPEEIKRRNIKVTPAEQSKTIYGERGFFPRDKVVDSHKNPPPPKEPQSRYKARFGESNPADFFHDSPSSGLPKGTKRKVAVAFGVPMAGALGVDAYMRHRRGQKKMRRKQIVAKPLSNIGKADNSSPRVIQGEVISSKILPYHPTAFKDSNRLFRERMREQQADAKALGKFKYSSKAGVPKANKTNMIAVRSPNTNIAQRSTNTSVSVRSPNTKIAQRYNGKIESASSQKKGNFNIVPKSESPFYGNKQRLAIGGKIAPRTGNPNRIPSSNGPIAMSNQGLATIKKPQSYRAGPTSNQSLATLPKPSGLNATAGTNTGATRRFLPTISRKKLMIGGGIGALGAGSYYLGRKNKQDSVNKSRIVKGKAEIPQLSKSIDYKQHGLGENYRYKQWRDRQDEKEARARQIYNHKWRVRYRKRIKEERAAQAAANAALQRFKYDDNYLQHKAYSDPSPENMLARRSPSTVVPKYSRKVKQPRERGNPNRIPSSNGPIAIGNQRSETINKPKTQSTTGPKAQSTTGPKINPSPTAQTMPNIETHTAASHNTGTTRKLLPTISRKKLAIGGAIGAVGAGGYYLGNRRKQNGINKSSAARTLRRANARKAKKVAHKLPVHVPRVRGNSNKIPPFTEPFVMGSGSSAPTKSFLPTISRKQLMIGGGIGAAGAGTYYAGRKNNKNNQY